jgi:transposase
MAKPLITDELWEVIEPLLPPEPEKPRGGRPRIPNRDVLRGILFVLATGLPWEYLPPEMGCGSGMTCWRRLKEWHEAGVRRRLHQAFAQPPRGGRPHRLVTRFSGLLGRARAKGGAQTGKNPTDRGKPGTKRHVVVDRQGIPLAVVLSAANVHDSRMMLETVDAIEPITRPVGRPRKRPAKLHADKAYDSGPLREELRRRGITPRIARRGIESSERLGRHRWVVERTLAWLNRYRRLRIRYERRADMHLAFLHIGCALICWNFINH